MKGFIYLHRKLLENPVFDNPHLLKVWIWCLLKASHARHDVLIGRQNITLEPGQFIFGRAVAAEALKMKQSTVRNYMAYLERYQMIINNPDNKYTLVTITNWASHQTYLKNLDNCGTAVGQQRDTYNNGNTGKPVNTVNENAHFPDGKEGVCDSVKSPIVTAAIGYYMQAYQKKYHSPHPDLNPKQWADIQKRMTLIGEEHCLDDEGWKTLVDYHHGRNLDTDGHISHFATAGIVQNAFYKTLY
jgi:hypothetical protein